MTLIHHDQPIDPNSRSSRKDDLDVLRKLGMTIVALTDGKFSRLDLPEPVRAAALEVRRLTAPDARRRQLLHVIARLDECDQEQLKKCMNLVERAPVPALQEQHGELDLAASLLDGGDAKLFELSTRFDVTKLQTLRNVVRHASKLLQNGKARDMCIKSVADCLRALTP